jgi:hypothetical protein
MSDDEKRRLEEWNKPRVTFLSHKEQLALVALIRRVQKKDWKDVELLDSESKVLKGIYDKLRPDVVKRMKNLTESEEEK